MTEDINCEWKGLIKVLLPKDPEETGKDIGISSAAKNDKSSCLKCSLTLRKSCLISLAFIIVVGISGRCEARKNDRSIIGTTSGGSQEVTITTDVTESLEVGSSESPRTEKAKAKWKGEKFWVESISNLTKLESEKTDAENGTSIFLNQTTANPLGQDASSSRKISSASSIQTVTLNVTMGKNSTEDVSTGKSHKKKSGNTTQFNLPKVNRKVTKAPGILPRTTLTADLSQYGQQFYLEYESEDDVKDKITRTTSSTSGMRPKRKKSKGTLKVVPPPPKTHPPRKDKGKKNKGKYSGLVLSSSPKPKQKGKRKKPVVIKNNKVVQVEIDREEENDSDDDQERSTLVADLAPYGQDVYLEYDSDELVEDIKKNSTGNSSVSVQFYPKTPINVLNLLQALVQQTQPIKMASVAGGEAPAIPVRYNVNITNRVPVRINPPSSPFLFSLDLDSFFSRMAISLFYSLMAIAPLGYLMMGSASVLPSFTLGRGKRSLFGSRGREYNNFDFFDKNRTPKLDVAFQEFYDKVVHQIKEKFG